MWECLSVLGTESSEVRMSVCVFYSISVACEMKRREKVKPVAGIQDDSERACKN